MTDSADLLAPWQSIGGPPMAGRVGPLCDICGISTNVELGGGDAEFINRPNVDCRDLPTVDFLCDLASQPIPFHDGHARSIRMIHLLNHLSQASGARLLRECFRVLRPHGVLYLMVTDLAFVCERIIADGPQTCWIGMLHGTIDDTHPEGFHKWNYTPESLQGLLQDIGFFLANPVGYYNRWDMKMLAVKP